MPLPSAASLQLPQRRERACPGCASRGVNRIERRTWLSRVGIARQNKVFGARRTRVDLVVNEHLGLVLVKIDVDRYPFGRQGRLPGNFTEI